MNAANRKLNIRVEWDKAQEAWKEAKALYEKEMPGGAISRVYYAAFHAGKALLLTDGIEVKSHQALGRLFSLHFVKTNRLESKFSRILSKAQKFREEADYSSEYSFNLADAQERLKEVEEFLKAAESYIKNLP